MGDSSKTRWPGETDEAHPDIFCTIPPQPVEKKDGQFTPEQVKQFFEEGYVLVEDFFKPSELQPVREAIKVLVEDLAQKLYNAGKIKKLYQEYGLFQRLIMIDKEFPGANILLHKLGKLPQAFRDLWSHERLLNVVEQLIGPDIAGHPVWNLRTKTPRNEATTVPWHQDVGYLDNESYKVLQPTAWIPLLNAKEENGCMQVIRRGHRTGKVAKHECCAGGTWYVMLYEEEIEKTLDVKVEENMVTCHMPYGGVLFFNNLVPHRSLNNLSKDIRWSLDLRWQNPSQPYGFYGVKQGVVMRSSTDPNLTIDWESFDSVDRNKEQKKAIQDQDHQPEDPESDEFDTTITGPWMKKWDIVHHNQHTANLTEEDVGPLTWHRP